MTNVVFHNRSYWLEENFHEQSARSEAEPIFVRMECGNAVVTILDPTLLKSELAERVATWVVSFDKSVSIFIEGLTGPERLRAIQLYDRAVKRALARIAVQFQARTGAQGKTRVSCEVNYSAVCQGEAQDGSPHWHHHVAFSPRVRVPGSLKTFAFNGRELYRLREQFNAICAHEVAYAFQRKYGIRVEHKAGIIRFVDVPRDLCRESASRTKQINQFILDKKLSNTPLTRRYVAFVTRRGNTNRLNGREAFLKRLEESHFTSKSICHKVPRNQKGIPFDKRQTKRQVSHVARLLARSQGSFTRDELLIRSLTLIGITQSTKAVALAVNRVVKSPKLVTLIPDPSGKCQPRYTAKGSSLAWKKVIDRIDAVVSNPTHARQDKEQNNADQNKGKSFKKASGFEKQQANRNGDSQEEKSNAETEQNKKFKRILRYCSVIYAVGSSGKNALKCALELYKIWRKPIWHIRGDGDRYTRGSLAAAIRDLKKLSRFESHKEAIEKMSRLNTPNLNQQLAYGEAVFRNCRKPKFRVPRSSLIVIKNVQYANAHDLDFMINKAKRAKAKIILVDREYSRSALVQFAKTIAPGGIARFRSQEQQR